MEKCKLGKINHEKKVNENALVDQKSIKKVVDEQGQRLSVFKERYTKQRDALKKYESDECHQMDCGTPNANSPRYIYGSLRKKCLKKCTIKNVCKLLLKQP